MGARRAISMLFSALLSLLVAGCAQPNQLVVVVTADFDLADSISFLSIAAFGERGGTRAETMSTATAPLRFPLTLTVLPSNTGGDVTIDVLAQVTYVDGRLTSLGRRVRTTIAGSRMLEVRLTRACLVSSGAPRDCGNDSSCTPSGCQPNEIAASDLMPWDGTLPTADTIDNCRMRAELCNGYDDNCDGDVDELTDFASDPSNCGACGVACADGVCSEGFCAGTRTTGVSVGANHVCIAVEGGDVLCHGSNFEGQSSAAPRAFIDRLQRVGSLTSRVRSVAAGSHHTCFLDEAGAVSCVGDGDDGAIGTAALTDSRAPNPIALPASATAIAAGQGVSCAIAGGVVHCWGRNDVGQLGTAPSEQRMPSPVAVSLPAMATSVSVGRQHACALLADQRVACWGSNTRGQLGTGRTSMTERPAVIPSLVATAISAGGDFTCAIDTAGTRPVRCWGANDVGQLGNGTTTATTMLSAVTGSEGAISIGAAHGGQSACLVGAERRVRCWGMNATAQLGLSGPLQSSTPMNLAAVTNAATVECGGNFSDDAGQCCSTTTTGVVQCWGYNYFGQIEFSASLTLPPTVVYPAAL